MFDNGASNYLFGCQPMTRNMAWQRHGCYKLGSEQYYRMGLNRALLGCQDNWNSLDHFNDAFLQGHLGHLMLNIPWANLTSKPAEIVIEDLYVLAVPAAESKVDLEEDETRAQASKQEWLNNAEVFQKSSKDLNANDVKRTQGVFESLVAKIVYNVQVTVKNVHVRYEDKLSVPGVC